MIGGFALVRPEQLSELLHITGTPSADATTPAPTAEPVLAGMDENAPQPTAAKLKALLDKSVTTAGIGPVNISVVDALTGTTLYDRGGQETTTPASTTKLLTAAAVLSVRGADHRITTSAVAGPKGGEVVLVGAGDPTLGVGPTTFYQGAARLDELAKQVKAALAGVAPTKVIIDPTIFPGSTLGPGWDEDIATGGYGARISGLMVDGARTSPKRNRDIHASYDRSAQPDLAAGQAFAKLLGLPISAVTKGKAAEGAAVLGSVTSPTVGSMVEVMLAESDNVVAEAMARQVAIAKGKPATFENGGIATAEVLAGLGADPAQIKLVDGSGLSRRDAISPAVQTYLLALAAGPKHPELRGLFAGLPVGAWSGTLNDRFKAKSVAGGGGLVRAKTGTLSAVNAISGIVVTKDGRLLAFAILADQVPVDNDIARDQLDVIANTIAACGCR
ncbi:D-alanyl-D-alanine carboxypeptidase/D-alanyl-D-alanine-endopeptidase (penicillin-binding protein 4) [Allocatelliglobosispora scoriae]|uniref:D-alanyl-D-alanine carboxypeptidase/D-alanyl-D-alanine-endopeptidase (Penicillin-binding protein 4) n=1 Tax=Allocatelliglobosispora scoriae TaxID=643052 RepID=A0A841BU65_9ACTN|nr:D-alanyl-D-alanine carboxypeptidase/D-alanyl-D-alanine-endopeptidase [Allocatelliglobosispora scoriae]MBB5871235.1 D-alanyl-D-alanine carboxypeptidase/D-alanyl-D-alanine-endopeptidase (penicillin-binding protein 4) [Allocatelliglobosispora scoriae]